MTTDSNDTTVTVYGEIVDDDDLDLVPFGPKMAAAGRAADRAATANLFAEFRAGRASNTVRSHIAGLALFVRYLVDAGAVDVPANLAHFAGATDDDLCPACRRRWQSWLSDQATSWATGPAPWAGVTWGLVAGFRQWQLKRGYAIGSINGRLATVRSYARLAHDAGVLDAETWSRIANVSGYGGQQATRVDEKRQDAEIPTRIGDKKPAPVTLTDEQAERLLDQPTDTPQGRRDRLLVHLALLHGLRVSELARLQVGDITLNEHDGRLVFYRPKLAGHETETGRHRLTNSTFDAARSYLTQDAVATGLLFRASDKRGRLTSAGMTTRRLSSRLRVLAEKIGVDGFTAHDARHYAATRQATKGVRHLMEFGGWKRPDTALGYVKALDLVDVE